MLDERDLFWCYIRRACIFNILLNSFLRIGVSVSQNICFLRMSYVYSKSVNSLFYGHFKWPTIWQLLLR